jgi:hypothetical protein
MLPAVTSTHAIPKQLPHGRLSPKGQVTVCPHCFAVLGTASNNLKRRELEARHDCTEKMMAQQPATSVPFS